MTVVFVFLYLVGLYPVIHRKQRTHPLLLLTLLAYFTFSSGLTDLFLSHEFPNLFWKCLYYGLLIAAPTFLLLRFRSSILWVIAGLAAGFLLILPVSRPTDAFLRAGYRLKLQLFPQRFVENLARSPAISADVEILEYACGRVDVPAESLLIARLRNLDVPVSSGNSCVLRASDWSGPDGVTHGEQTLHTTAGWREAYGKGNDQQRIAILNRLRREGNPALIDSAIECIGGDSEDLIIAAVRYLRFFSGKWIGNDREQWLQWRNSSLSSVGISTISSIGAGSPLAARGYSAILLLDDLTISKESGTDFLSRYLKHHFPQPVSHEDLNRLNAALEKMPGDTASDSYRRGVFLFFLALVESRLVVQADLPYSTKIYNRWNASLGSLQKSGAIGHELAVEVQQILKRADANRNEYLELEELQRLLTPVD